MAWRVEAEGFDPVRERQMESLFAVGNGYLGVRGALDTPPPGSQCDLFVAGIYDLKRADLPYSEIEFLAPERDGYPYVELVPLPFPFQLRLSIEGEPLDFAGSHGRELRRTLDLRGGVLEIEAVYETSGRTAHRDPVRAAAPRSPIRTCCCRKCGSARKTTGPWSRWSRRSSSRSWRCAIRTSSASNT